MSADPSGAAWTRGTPSSLVLAFLGVAGAIWLLALVLWEIGRPDLAVVATGLRAAGPPLLLFFPFSPLPPPAARPPPPCPPPRPRPRRTSSRPPPARRRGPPRGLRASPHPRCRR